MKTSRNCCFPSGRSNCLRLLAVVFSVALASAALTAGAEQPRTIKFIDYIESSGTQYINTGFSPTHKNVRLEMTYRFVSLPAATAGSRKYVFGSCQGTNNVRFQYAVGSEGNCAFGFGEGWVNNATVDSYDTDKIHTIVCSNGVFTLDGNVVKDLSSSKFESPDANAPVCLFANNNKGSASPTLMPSMRLYSCRIWNNDELVRDFVPALDDNSTACLYDIVGESFYSNADSGDFTAGEVTREVSLSYRKADYIETECTAFIDTGYVPNGNTKLEMEFAFTKEVDTKRYVFGTYASGGGRYMFSYGPASTGCFLGYGTNYQNNVSGLTYNTERHVIKYVPEFGFYFDGEPVTTATVNLTEWIVDKDKGKNIFLCTCNRNGGNIDTSLNAPIRIYSCKIWETNAVENTLTLKRDFVPKQRRFDGKNGLYDTVSSKFYGYYGSSTDFTAHFSSGMLIIVR